MLAIRVTEPERAAEAAAELADLTTGDEPLVDTTVGEIRLAVADPSASAEALRRLDARRVAISAIALQQPSLDDVFLTLTGRPAEAEPTHQRPEAEAA